MPGNGVYVLANKGDGAGFYKWTGGLLGAGRVYLEKTGSGTAPTYIPFGYSETTNIKTTDYTNYTDSDGWFTLDGRKLDTKPTKKGIYIYKGKKVIM